MTKLRYGLQLCTNVRTEESEIKSTNMKAAQVAQNKLMRLLTNAKYNDHTSTKVLLEKSGLLSVNQTAASIKLTEVWKGINIMNYPIQLEPNNPEQSENPRVLRPTSVRMWNQDASEGYISA